MAQWLLPLPVLDETRCIVCRECVVLCPTTCLALGRQGPWLPRPLDCISCGLCVLICPTEALELRQVTRRPH